jgi:hypothetical protein
MPRARYDRIEPDLEPGREPDVPQDLPKVAGIRTRLRDDLRLRSIVRRREPRQLREIEGARLARRERGGESQCKA